MDKGAPSSGNAAWDKFRNAVAKDPQLRTEIEGLMRLSVETYNPSERGARFILGTVGEWMITFAAYAAGVLTLPEGHNANGHDLRGLLGQVKDLWSIKSSYTKGTPFIITNGLGGAGRGMEGPVIFWSPGLPGLVYVDPELHAEVAAAQVVRPDQVTLKKSAVLGHAQAHSECVIECHIPTNPKTATKDAGFEAVRLLVLGGSQFIRLRKMLDDVAAAPDTSVVAQVRELVAMKNNGDLPESAFEALLSKITGA